MTPEERASAIAYRGDEWTTLAPLLSPEEAESYLEDTLDTIGYQAWKLTGTHDNIVTRTIEAHRDAFLAPIIRDILDDE